MTNHNDKPNQLAPIKKAHGFTEYKLDNGLTVLHHYIPDTKVITSNIVYKVGSIDEAVGESGVAHMLEHMLFKPTKQDFKRKQTESSAMKFEREVGVLLNASTWRDRTNYYFSYGREHFKRALTIEAERMRDTTLEDSEFKPERNNVLSEYDMYNGRPDFALATAVSAAAFVSHPYGHETIGFREDIERYTTEKLKRFYDRFYRPDNATLIICGDVDETEMKQTVISVFSKIKPPAVPLLHTSIIEPKQEGTRRTTVTRPGTVNLLALGVKHPGFPEMGWYETMALLEILAGNEESVLHRSLVDTGYASTVSYSIEPTKDINLATIFLTLTDKISGAKLEHKVLTLINDISIEQINKKLPTLVARTLADMCHSRDSSMSLAMELTEYIASGDWTNYFTTDKKLKRLTAEKIKQRASDLFKDANLTIGNYESIS